MPIRHNLVGRKKEILDLPSDQDARIIDGDARSVSVIFTGAAGVLSRYALYVADHWSRP